MERTILIIACYILTWMNSAVCSGKSPTLYIGECVTNDSVLITNISGGNKHYLTNNYPGTCLNYCDRNDQTTAYIALRQDVCLCGKYYTKTNNYPLKCNATCPGHNDHLCGSTTTEAYSTYAIDRNRTINESSCIHYDVTSNNIEEGRCSNETVWICSRFELAYCNSDNVAVTWEQAMKTFRINRVCQPYYTFNTTRFPGPVRFVIPPRTKCPNRKNYWIPAFGRRAPPKKNCSMTHNITNGSVTYDNEIEAITYICSNGYKLEGVSTRSCMSDGSWSGHEPKCSSDQTENSSTTSKTVNQSEPTHTTRRSTISTPSKTQSKGLPLPTIIGAGAGGVIVIVSLVTGCYCLWRYKQRMNNVGDEKEHGEHNSASRVQAIEIPMGPAATSYTDRQTRNTASPLSQTEDGYIDESPNHPSKTSHDYTQRTVLPGAISKLYLSNGGQSPSAARTSPYVSIRSEYEDRQIENTPQSYNINTDNETECENDKETEETSDFPVKDIPPPQSNNLHLENRPQSCGLDADIISMREKSNISPFKQVLSLDGIREISESEDKNNVSQPGTPKESNDSEPTHGTSQEVNDSEPKQGTSTEVNDSEPTHGTLEKIDEFESITGAPNKDNDEHGDETRRKHKHKKKKKKKKHRERDDEDDVAPNNKETDDTQQIPQEQEESRHKKRQKKKKHRKKDEEQNVFESSNEHGLENDVKQTGHSPSGSQTMEDIDALLL